ncbi:MAG: hypothetical protein AAF909_08875, partial [Pseudomonadota bacterium]
GLRIRLIGPGPATSFAAVTVDAPDPQAVAEAAAALGVETAAEPEAVAAAYRAAMKTAHPDVARHAAQRAAETAPLADPRQLSAANALLKRVAAARASLRQAGFTAPTGALMAAAAPPLMRLRREGDGAAG